MNSPDKELLKFLNKREADGALRSLPEKSHLIDFCSNDYLGFARSDLLREKIKEELNNCPDPVLGASGSRLITGNSRYYEELERFIADYHKEEAGLIFNSGYNANLGFWMSVPQHNDLVVFDDYVHASIRDGLKLTRGKAISFAHNDLDDLRKKLQGDYQNKYIAVESVYSMDGDFAPLEALVELCEQTRANLVVDEAHATGLFGKKGEGRVVELELEEKCFARIHTFSKALGNQGAVVLGSKILRDFLINFSRPFIFSTALPFYSLITIKKAYDILSNSNDSILYISELLSLFKQEIKVKNSYGLIESQSPIQCVIIPGNERVLQVSNELEKVGIYAKGILYPTVPRGKERIRICFHSFNTKDEVMLLVETLNRCMA